METLRAVAGKAVRPVDGFELAYVTPDGEGVRFEAWLEHDHLMLLDFDPAVAAIASQPFWMFWVAAEGKARSRAPATPSTGSAGWLSPSAPDQEPAP